MELLVQYGPNRKTVVDSDYTCFAPLRARTGRRGRVVPTRGRYATGGGSLHRMVRPHASPSALADPTGAHRDRPRDSISELAPRR